MLDAVFLSVSLLPLSTSTQVQLSLASKQKTLQQLQEARHTSRRFAEGAACAIRAPALSISSATQRVKVHDVHLHVQCELRMAQRRNRRFQHAQVSLRSVTARTARTSRETRKSRTIQPTTTTWTTLCRCLQNTRNYFLVSCK